MPHTLELRLANLMLLMVAFAVLPAKALVADDVESVKRQRSAHKCK